MAPRLERAKIYSRFVTSFWYTPGILTATTQAQSQVNSREPKPDSNLVRLITLHPRPAVLLGSY